MIKKTIYIGNPATLSLRLGQMVVHRPDVEQSNLPEFAKQDTRITRPIEDIGVLVLDHQQITITQGLMAALVEANVAIVSCDRHCMPTGLMLPLDMNTTQCERFTLQIGASLPLKKQLWQQTIRQKIENQAAVLEQLTPTETGCMHKWAADVKSGDAENHEARAAAYYWRNLFAGVPGLELFIRGREEAPPNNLLNYGYAILRATVARALVSTGLLPTLGIHHHNRYNAYCLADDIMEPYRPYVDKLVFGLVGQFGVQGVRSLTRELKSYLLTIPTMDVTLNGKRSPLMVAVSQTTASLQRCFAGESRKIVYPVVSR